MKLVNVKNMIFTFVSLLSVNSMLEVGILGPAEPYMNND